VRVLAEIEHIDGSQITFSVQAWDEVEKIGEGNHKRVIIDEERFIARVEKKGSAGSE
jgi:predicted thioesterase